MPFKKGKSGNPRGRKVGTPNKATAALRDFFTAFHEQNQGRVQALFEAAVVKDPVAALRLYLDAAEFVKPKLARTEISGTDGGPLLTRVVHEEADVRAGS